MKYLFLWLLLLRIGWPALAQPLRSQPVISVATSQQQLSLQGKLFFLQDTSGAQTLTDILSPSEQAAFKPVTSPVPNFGVITGTQTAKPIWLRFRLNNPTSLAQNWLVDVSFWSFDELQLFTVSDSGQVVSSSRVIGWRTPASQRIRHHRNYWFPFVIPAHQSLTAYLRVLKHRGTQIIPVKLVRESAYEPTVQKTYLFWGGVVFTLLFVAVMSLIFYLNTFTQLYLRYVFCLLGLVGFFVINNGLLNQFAFQAQFWLPRQNVYFLFPLVLFYSQLVFVRQFLPLHTTPARWLASVGQWVLWAGLACLLIITGEWLVPYSPTTELILVRLFSLLYWLPMPVIVAYIITSIVRKYYVREGWLYLVAIFPFYALNLGLVFANFRLIPTYQPLADFVYYAAAALFEVLVLTVGLAYRYKMDRDQTERLIKQQTIQQQRTYEAEVQALAMKNSLLIEKERIARDLHDNVGAHLAFVVTNLTHISDQAEKQSIKDGRKWAVQLRSIVMHTREAVKLLRETIWAIHQESFTVEEFGERLNQYINRYVHETDGLMVDVAVTGSQTYRLTSTQVLNLFRIVQEALNNVVKHAEATQANVQLQVRANGHISLRIHDNGRGFSWPNQLSTEPHYGLQNMQARALELGGTFQVVADQGTTVAVEI